MKKGFTLVEVLIVITLIAILIVAILMSMRRQVDRANDAKRKSDLYVTHNALEEYNTDHSVFPAEGIISSCGGSALSPYLQKILCDPQTQGPYGYFPSAATGGYRVCTKLADTTDPDIEKQGCGGTDGCGLGGGYNYCLASGTTPSAVGTADQIFASSPTPTNTPTPMPTLNPGYHLACTPGGVCNSYSNPSAHGCPISWQFDCPVGACAVQANRCAN